jgi:heptaprenyl diphosphate synthase
VTGHLQEGEWLRCSRTAALLTKLDDVLEQAVTADDTQLKVMALHIIRRGGKRLRPALLLLCGSYGTTDEARLLRAAAALELTHVASLYHDDVMDRAPVRRGGASTNARWGSPQAAFAGTYLFSRACELWASLGHESNELAADMAVNLCLGQLHEVERAYDAETTDETHLRILEMKTGSLFELPCRMGALLSDQANPVADALARYGRSLGVAFQLADDVLDLTGDTEAIGKLAGKDLQEGVYSLAVLRALRSEEVGVPLHDLLARAALRDADVREAIRLVRESGAIEQARSLAEEYAAEATASLADLPAGPATDSLHRLAHLTVTRAF